MESSATVERALDVLFHLLASGEASGVTAIGRALSLPKSTVHRLLAALAARALVERDARGRYRLGIGLVALGLGAQQLEPVVRAARPSLEEQALASGETFFVVGVRAGRIIVLDKVEGTGLLRVAPRVGDTVPIHGTAVGRVLAAFGDGAIATLAANPVSSLAAGQAVSAASPDELREIREQGYAESFDEWIEGMSALAAPVWLGDRVVGVIAVAAATPRIIRIGTSALAERVQSAAAQTGRRLMGATA